MPATLVSLDGAADIPIAGLLTVIGRHRDCDALLDSSKVSRRHCCLALAGGEVLVRDLGSTNGIAINGRRTDEGLLRPGDILTIAHLCFRLDWGDGQGSRRPSPPGWRADEGEPSGPRDASPDREPNDEGPTDGKGSAAVGPQVFGEGKPSICETPAP